MDYLTKKVMTDAKFLLALIEDSEEKRKNIVKCIENGADVNKKFSNYNNNTPLHIAIKQKNKEIIEILLSQGARVDVPNDAGQTALDVAREVDHSIAKLLEKFNKTDAMNSYAASRFRYKKHLATAGIPGQLYETKLLTMILIRALRSKQINQFYLASNIDGIGDMDDVCMRFKTDDEDSVLFLQAKHAQDVDKRALGVQDLWQNNGDFSLHRYFKSYKKIRGRFNDCDDDIFRGKYEDVKPHFVVYTPRKFDLEDKCKSFVGFQTVGKLIESGHSDNIFKLAYTDEDIMLLTKQMTREHVKILGRKLFQMVSDMKYNNMLLNDQIMLNYHVLLAQKVFNVSHIEDGHRKAVFREDFFSSKDEFLILLRDTLYAEAIERTKITAQDIENMYLTALFTPPFELVLKLFHKCAVYDRDSNTLRKTREAEPFNTYVQFLIDSIKLTRNEITELWENVGKDKFVSLVFTLPSAFGNLDMTVKKKTKLQYLSDTMCDIIQQRADNEGTVVLRQGVYEPNENIPERFFALIGGIASAVGNLLIPEDTNALKFNPHQDVLGENAKHLHMALSCKLGCLEKYRFIIESDSIPRYSFGPTEHEKKQAEDFLDNLYFYTSQTQQNQLDVMVTTELADQASGLNTLDCYTKSTELFLKIHNEVQSWWMSENTSRYLSRNMPIFEKMFRDWNSKGLIEFYNFVYLTQMETAGHFDWDASNMSAFLNGTAERTIVIRSDHHKLTSRKLLHYFINECIFIDLDYVSQGSVKCLEMVVAELGDTNDNAVIIICKDVSQYNIRGILRLCTASKIIIVTDKPVFLERCSYYEDE